MDQTVGMIKREVRHEIKFNNKQTAENVQLPRPPYVDDNIFEIDDDIIVEKKKKLLKRGK